MKERFFVCDSVSGGKFWRVCLDGNTVFIAFGKLETEGQNTFKDFETSEQAEKFMNKKIQEKQKKGYQEIVE